MAGRDLFAVEPTEQPVTGRDLFASAPQAQPVQPVGIQPVNIGDIAEQYRSGSMPANKRPYFEELVNRGVVPGWAKAFQPTEDQGISTIGAPPKVQPTGKIGKDIPLRQIIMAQEAAEMGVGESFLTGMGQGFTTIGRGVGLIEPAGEIEKEAVSALHAASPIAAGAGEIIGEAAPFVPLAMATGGIGSLTGRAIGTGAVSAAEGGIIQAGKGEDVLEGAAIGGGVGLLAEIVVPVIGRLGGKVVRGVTGKAPKGALVDAAGKPTQELSEALSAAGMTFEDLAEDAQVLLSKQQTGTVPGQAATAAMAAEEGIPLTKGEITKGYQQQAVEQRLLESAEDTAAEPLRQYKLKQSESIKENLRSNFSMDVDTEETGQLIQDALTGRKKLLRTQKNELYEAATESAKDIGGVPIFTDNLQDAIPDADMLEDLAITAPQAMQSLDGIMTKYGLKEPTQAMVDAGFEPTPLTIQNFERFRKTLNAIKRGDQTGAAGVGIDPIINALDDELMEVDNIIGGLSRQGQSQDQLEQIADIRDTLKSARKTTRELKTEFSPKSIIGRVVDVKKDGVTPVTEASKVYNKLVANSAPVEEMRRVVKSLRKSGEKGEQALASLQSATIMDLIDAGFGTESRKISGVKTFNPIAFKRRLEKVGQPKLEAMFANNKQVLRKLKNIDAIASDLIPPSGAQPKGSASVILDLANTLGLATIMAKIPGGALLTGSMKKIAQPVKTGIDVRKALTAEPDVIKFKSMIEQQFPGLASAIGTVGALEASEGTTP